MNRRFAKMVLAVCYPKFLMPYYYPVHLRANGKSLRISNSRSTPYFLRPIVVVVVVVVRCVLRKIFTEITVVSLVKKVVDSCTITRISITLVIIAVNNTATKVNYEGCSLCVQGIP